VYEGQVGKIVIAEIALKGSLVESNEERQDCN
jgi:hypothetical protein